MTDVLPQPDAARRRWRRVVPAVAAVLAVVGVETGLRFAASRAEEAAWGYYVPDARRGWGLRPGFRGWETAENHVWLEINSDGLRDREHPVPTPPGTLRIAVLGDSFMEAVNLPREKIFTSVLEQRLARCVGAAGRRPEVLNFGVAGYGTAQELLTYRHHAVRYQPDIVLLAVFTGNDVVDNYRDRHQSFMQEIPLGVLRDGRQALEAARVDEPPAALAPWYHRARLAIMARFLVVQPAWDAYALLRSPFVAPQLPEVNHDPDAPEMDYRIYQPQTATFEEAWQITEALLLRVAREVRAQGAEFWVLTLANAEQVNPDRAARRSLADALGAESLFHPEQRLREFGRSHDIPVISLAEPLADHAAANRVFLHGGYNADYPAGTGHWNETAHRLAAGIVGDRLCSSSPTLARLR